MRNNIQKPSPKSATLLVRPLLAMAVVVAIAIGTRMSTASFSPQDVVTHVEIDGINYGSFDEIEGLEQLAVASETERGDQGFKRITFKRDFVTDPSLYLWAKNIMHGRSDLKDVHIVMGNRDGEELSRYVLKFCQPLSWTVEAANPALGGFHEKIDLAVQEIAIY